MEKVPMVFLLNCFDFIIKSKIVNVKARLRMVSFFSRAIVTAETFLYRCP